VAAATAMVGCAAIGDPAGLIDDAPDPDGGARIDGAPGAVDAAPPPDAQPCVEGDVQIEGGGSCYMLFLTRSTWDTARLACQALGGHLATAASQAENDLFSSIAPSVAGSGDEDVWIGGTDQAVEGTWVWDNGEPMTFEGWRLDPLEPNDGGDGPGGAKIENCMIIEGDRGGTWDDRDCPTLYPYMCERG
jgi:hypothetical protein